MQHLGSVGELKCRIVVSDRRSHARTNYVSTRCIMHPSSSPPAQSFPLPTPILYPVDPPFLRIFHSDSLTRWSPPLPLLYTINFPPRAGPFKRRGEKYVRTDGRTDGWTDTERGCRISLADYRCKMSCQPLSRAQHAQDLQGLSRAQPAPTGHRHSQSAPLPFLPGRA